MIPKTLKFDPTVEYASLYEKLGFVPGPLITGQPVRPVDPNSLERQPGAPDPAQGTPSTGGQMAQSPGSGAQPPATAVPGAQTGAPGAASRAAQAAPPTTQAPTTSGDPTAAQAWLQGQLPGPPTVGQQQGMSAPADSNAFGNQIARNDGLGGTPYGGPPWLRAFSLGYPNLGDPL